MKERILQLSKGNICGEYADIVCFPSAIEQVVSSEYTAKTEIFIQSRNKIPVKALVYSTDHRVVPSETSVMGVKCCVHLEVLCAGMKPESVIKGAIQFVAEGREFEIPYEFTVARKDENGIVPVVENIKEFAALADKDYTKALKMFTSAGFTGMPFMQNLKVLALYESLIHGTNASRAMEEFLVSMDAKKPVAVTTVITNKVAVQQTLIPQDGTDVKDVVVLDETPMTLVGGERPKEVSVLTYEIGTLTKVSLDSSEEHDDEEEYRSLMGAVVLKMTHPGFVSISIEHTVPFLRTAKSKITLADFDPETNEAVIPFEILPERLYPGDNCGAILVAFPDRVYETQILVHNHKDIYPGLQKTLMDSHLFAEFYECMIELMIRGTNSGAGERALDRAMEIVTYKRHEEPANLHYSLAMAYLYYQNNDIEDFRSIMEASYDDVSECRKTDVDLYCFYLYLRYLMKPGTEQKDTVARLLKKYYVEQKDSLFLLLMLLKVDEQLSENEALAYEMLREQYTKGSRSPLLYLAACECILSKPEHLKKLEGFELQAVLFGARKGMITEDLAATIASLALYERDFRPQVFRLLKYVYAMYPSKTVLTGLLCVIMNGRKTNSRYFTWFEKGIAEDVRLTGLYENYLSAVPHDLPYAMPAELLLFCADKEDLSVESKEHLYHNIITYFEPDSKIYKEYKEQMESFTIDQLMAGRYNLFLIELYKEFLFAEMVDERIAQVLPQIVCVNHVVCQAEDVSFVIVRYPEVATEYRIRMKNCEACVPIYDSKSAIIVFEDSRGVRYSTFSYTMTPLMEDSASYLELCREHGTTDMLLSILDTRKLLKKALKKPEDVYRVMLLLDMAEVHPSYKVKVTKALLAYCSASEGMDAMDSFLLSLDVKDLDEEDRLTLIELLSKRGFVRETYQILQMYGLENVSLDILMSVGRYMILQTSYGYDQFLLNICLDLYRQKKYNNVMISYLLRYFNGVTEEMLDLLNAGDEGVQVEMADFPERLLGQMMFTGHYDRLEEVFLLYQTEQQKADKPLYQPLVLAYFVIMCHRHFMEDKENEDELYRYLEQRLMEDPGYEIADICKIDLLKMYSSKAVLEKTRVNLAARLLDELYARGYLFAFYSDLRKHIALPEMLNGSVIVEVRNKKASRMAMNYRITDLNKEGGISRTLMMREVYPGVFAEHMTLFNDELLLFTAQGQTEDGTFVEGEENQETCIEAKHRFIITGSRFERINSAAGSSMMDVELEALLREITKTDLLTDKLFGLK